MLLSLARVVDLSLQSVTSDSVLTPESEVGPLTSEAGEEAWDLASDRPGFAIPRRLYGFR